MLDKEAAINKVKQYANVVLKELNPAAIVLYGSHAKGAAREDSDIDVAVVFDGFIGDWLATSSRLWHLTEDISLDIEPVLLDSAQDKSGFVQSIYKSGHVVYQR